jgi:hypothetical protein
MKNLNINIFIISFIFILIRLNDVNTRNTDDSGINNDQSPNLERGKGRSLTVEKRNVMRMGDNGKWIVTGIDEEL